MKLPANKHQGNSGLCNTTYFLFFVALSRKKKQTNKPYLLSCILNEECTCAFCIDALNENPWTLCLS